MKFHCPRVQQVFSFFILLSCAAALLPFPAMAAPCPEPLELEKEKLPEEQRPLARALARYYDALNGKDFDALQAILDPNRPANTHPGPKAFSYRSLLNWKRFRIYATEILCVEPEAGRISVKEWVEAEAYNGTVFYYNSPAVYTFLRTEEGSLLTARGTVSLDPLKTRDPFELLHLFRDALYRGEVPSALNAVERYLAERPGDYYALAMKGALQLQIQGEDTSVACATLETALEKMKRGAQVCTQLRQALFDAQVFDSLASCHQRKNDLRGALEHLRTALRRNPEYVPALLRRAEIEEESGRAQEAHRLYESAYRVLPDLPEAELALFGESAYGNNRAGMVALKEGRLDDAVALFRQAARDAPSYDKPLNNLGLVRERQANTAEALKLYERAHRLNPRNAAILLNIASLQNRLGKARAARKTLERILEIDPENLAALNFQWETGKKTEKTEEE